MAPKVLAGIVNVNSPTVNDEIHAPMGGVRDSGWGRTGPGVSTISATCLDQLAQRSAPVSLLNRNECGNRLDASMEDPN